MQATVEMQAAAAGGASETQQVEMQAAAAGEPVQPEPVVQPEACGEACAEESCYYFAHSVVGLYQGHCCGRCRIGNRGHGPACARILNPMWHN